MAPIFDKSSDNLNFERRVQKFSWTVYGVLVQSKQRRVRFEDPNLEPELVDVRESLLSALPVPDLTDPLTPQDIA